MIEIGILKNFDSETYKAGVQLAGSLTTYFDDISVAKNIPPSAMVTGNYVIVAIPGGNPRDACVIATWLGGSPGGGAGSFLDLSDTPSSYEGQAGKAPRVDSAENALEFARFLLSPTGTAEWKNRSYQGWELLTQATTYTVGTGGDFATLKEAADSLKGLILVQNLTIQLVSDVTENETVLFSGLLSAGGFLKIDFNNHTETINITSGTGYCLGFIGPFVVFLDGSKLSLNHHTYGPPYELLYAFTLQYLNLYSNLEIDFNNWAGSRGVGIARSRCYVYNMPQANWHNYGNTVCIAASHMTRAGFYKVNPPSFSVLAGGIIVDKDGHVHTEAGEFTP